MKRFDPPTTAAGAVSSDVPRVGDVLAAKYRIESILGAGGMGVVVLVEHVELGQRMAIKLLLPGAHDQNAVTRFVREARAAAALQSEHVVRIFDVGTLDNGSPFMVMELLRGQDLSQIVARNGPLPIGKAVEYVIQACHALGEAHGLGIVHRDLKPSNLFLAKRSDGSPLVKVLDFGISKAASSDSAFSGNLTATSAIMGSPLYMSPEQVRDAKQVDTRADIWSLGVILHELLTGRPAFQADTLPGVCAAIICDQPPPLRSLRHDAPVELEDVVARCLEKDIEKRFQTTRELMTALRQFTGSQVGVSQAPDANDEAMIPTRIPPSGLVTIAAPITQQVAPTQRVETGSVASTRVVPVELLPHPQAISNPGVTETLASSNASITNSGPQSALVPQAAPARQKWPLALGGVAICAVIAFLYVSGRPPALPTAAPATSPVVAAPPSPRKSFAMMIDSSPSGAEVVESDKVLGTTPIQLSVDNDTVRTEPRKLMLRRPGFQPYSIVQGASEENVRVLATLVVSSAQTASATPAASTSAAPPSTTKTTGGGKPATVVATQTPPPATTPVTAPPPVTAATPPDDIRLQR